MATQDAHEEDLVRGAALRPFCHTFVSRTNTFAWQMGHTEVKSRRERGLRSKLNLALGAVALMAVLIVVLLVVFLADPGGDNNAETAPPADANLCADSANFTHTTAVESVAVDASTDCAGLALPELSLPAGYRVEVFACNLESPRSLSLGKDGVVYVGSRKWGQSYKRVFAIVPDETKTRALRVVTFDALLNQPNGIAYADGSLYVATHRDLYELRGVDDVTAAARDASVGQPLKGASLALVTSDAFPSQSSLQW